MIDEGRAADDVRRCFFEYEAALVAQDHDALDGWFWDDRRVVRFGIAEIQYGAAAVAWTLNPDNRMIHFPSLEQEADAMSDPPQVCTKELTPTQLRAIMRALDDAVAESQRLRADLARRFPSSTTGPVDV